MAGAPGHPLVGVSIVVGSDALQNASVWVFMETHDTGASLTDSVTDGTVAQVATPSHTPRAVELMDNDAVDDDPATRDSNLAPRDMRVGHEEKKPTGELAGTDSAHI